jgi:hypothetical protein
MIPLTYSFMKVMGLAFVVVYLALSAVFISACSAVFTSDRRYLIKDTLFGLKPLPWRVIGGLILIPILAFFVRLVQVYLSSMRSGAARSICGTIVILIVSAILFRVKVTDLRTYAILECAFAMTACFMTMKGMADQVQPVQLLALATSAYLVIRGMDNFKKDLDERKASKLAADVSAAIVVASKP